MPKPQNMDSNFLLTWSPSCVCDDLSHHPALPLKSPACILMIYLCLCIYATAYIWRQAGKQIAPPFPCILMCYCRVFECMYSCPRQDPGDKASLMQCTYPDFPCPLHLESTACASCSVQTGFLPPTSLAEITGWGRRQQLDLSVEADARKRLLINHRNTTVPS